MSPPKASRAKRAVPPVGMRAEVRLIEPGFSVESFLNHKIFHASTKIIISVDMYASKTFLFTQKVILLQLYKCGVRY